MEDSTMIKVGQKYRLNESWPSHPRGDFVTIESITQGEHFPNSGNIGDSQVITDHHVVSGAVTLVVDVDASPQGSWEPVNTMLKRIKSDVAKAERVLHGKG
jgi:hypothetical protein